MKAKTEQTKKQAAGRGPTPWEIYLATRMEAKTRWTPEDWQTVEKLPRLEAILMAYYWSGDNNCN